LGGGWAWVRWGKSKSGAKALAFLSVFIGLSMFVGCLLALGTTWGYVCVIQNFQFIETNFSITQTYVLYEPF